MGEAAEQQAGRHDHARQFEHMQFEIRKLRSWPGHVIREVKRNGGEQTEALSAKNRTCPAPSQQRRNSKNKLYELHAHAPEVEWIAKVARPGQPTRSA